MNINIYCNKEKHVLSNNRYVFDNLYLSLFILNIITHFPNTSSINNYLMDNNIRLKSWKNIFNK